MRGFGDLEAVIMDRLWTRGEPTTVREIHTDLSEHREIAYTTVFTVMDNLLKKNWLRREPAGRAHRYLPVMSREHYCAGLMREALHASGNPAGALLGLVEQMTPAEAAVLRTALVTYEGGTAR